ncbi:MAG: PLD nuclease N-terminal domain-containing protein [Dehalococcoidia bacterium]
MDAMHMQRWGRKSWKDLTNGQRRSVQAVALVQVTLFLVALADLLRRPAEGVRGRKGMWFPALFVNFAGPLAYLVFGRRGSSPETPVIDAVDAA